MEFLKKRNYHRSHVSHTPVQQKPLANDFTAKIPNVAAITALSIQSGATDKPDFGKP